MTSELLQALSRLAGNRHSDGVSSVVTWQDRETIINGCHDMLLAARQAPSPQEHLESGSFGTEDSRFAYQRDHAPQEHSVGYGGRIAIALMRDGTATACKIHRAPVAGEDSVALYEHPISPHLRVPDLTNEQKEITLLRIIEAMKGTTDSSENQHSWLNWFCSDEIHNVQEDTFNRCNDKGWLHTTHNSDWDTSTTTLTAAGPAALTTEGQPDA